MRRYGRLIAVILGLCCISPAPAAATAATVADFAAFAAQVASGATEIQLAASISCNPDAPISPAARLTIVGNGFSLSDLVIDGGTVVFQNVRLTGMQGLADEAGGAALTLLGDGTTAILLGNTRAIGGTGGPEGARGGDGVALIGDRQGLILDGSAAAEGGIGYLEGGSGIRVLGCDAGLYLTGDTFVNGGTGLNAGGSAIDVPACCKVDMPGRTMAGGGVSVTDGGHALKSVPCVRCETGAAVSVSGGTALLGGIAQRAGNGIYIERSEAASAPSFDLTLGGSVALYGGAGHKAGAALFASGCAIQAGADAILSPGGYFAEGTPPVLLAENATIDGFDLAAQTLGAQLEKSPLPDVASTVNTALRAVNSRYVPQTIDDGLGTRELSTRLNGVTVERGTLSSGNANGTALKIQTFDTERMRRQDFAQWLMPDATETNGTRYVLIVTPSQDYLTVDCTRAALNKLFSLGVTQLAYTSKPPVYRERIYSLAPILDAAENWAGDAPVARVIFGTADDCIIFVLENEEWAYQVDLTYEALVQLEAAN